MQQAAERQADPHTLGYAQRDYGHHGLWSSLTAPPCGLTVLK
jgi:hypothetical protein